MPRSVLIVDDVKYMRDRLREILSELGVQVVGEAENGAIGVELYQTLHPDAVFMDVAMPEMNGLEALQRIKQADPMAKTLVCSASGNKEVVMEAIRLGAADFIAKPFQPDRVLQGLRRVFPEL